jgi:hypothetical protein
MCGMAILCLGMLVVAADAYFTIMLIRVGYVLQFWLSECGSSLEIAALNLSFRMSMRSKK